MPNCQLPLGHLVSQCHIYTRMFSLHKEYGIIAPGDDNRKGDAIIPRGNIIDEIGRIRAKLGDMYIILLEEGLSLPTNLSTGVIYETFTSGAFDSAVSKVIKSLRNHGVM